VIRSLSESSRDVQELLAGERQIPALPSAVRERVLARARDTLASVVASPPKTRRPLRMSRWLMVGAVLCLPGAAGWLAGCVLSTRA
jgi:hypothetical protein